MQGMSRLKHIPIFAAFIASAQGSLAMVWALALPVIIGFIALGVEASIWFMHKNDLQAATDAAAIATAYYIETGQPLNIIAGHEMERNGLGSTQHVSLMVNAPPVNGKFMGNHFAVELITSQPLIPLFSKLFLPNLTISARAVAVATPVVDAQGCVMARSKLQTDPLMTENKVTLSAPDCVFVNSSLSNTGTAINAGAAVTLKSIYSSGNLAASDSASFNHSAPNVINGSVLPDPLRGLPMPQVKPCEFTNFKGGQGGTMNPGVYCGGVYLGPDTQTVMNPGTYIINGEDFYVDGKANLSGSGVTIILTRNADVNIAPGATISLTAPSGGTYNGILFFGNPTSRNYAHSFTGGPTMNLAGWLYFPTQTIYFSGGVTGEGSCTKMIGYEIVFKGTSTLTTSCPAEYPELPVPAGGILVKLRE